MNSLPPIYLTSEPQRLGSARELRTLHANGRLERIATGAYIDSEVWAAQNSDERYRTRVRAAALISHPSAQFSLDSAAALWRLPSIGPWPVSMHELVDRAPGGSSRVGITRHALGRDPASVEIDGVRTTSLVRTLVDAAASMPFVRSVAMLDNGLRQAPPGHPRLAHVSKPPEPAEVLACLDALLPYRGAARARRAILYANALAGSPLESFSRVQFSAIGFPEPELQVRFEDERGLIGFADFYWRELGLIVEADGMSKYGDEREFQTDLSLRELLLAEKEREDRMRRQSRAFTRIGWQLANDRRALAAFLRPHGLVPRSRGENGGSRR